MKISEEIINQEIQRLVKLSVLSTDKLERDTYVELSWILTDVLEGKR